jgi:L-ascorbate metabolism protein UlaG (beta-lactamase superfamily)
VEKMSIQIRWLSHAAFQIKANGKTIYLDPRYMKSLESKIGSFFENPDKADVILFTHSFHAILIYLQYVCPLGM